MVKGTIIISRITYSLNFSTSEFKVIRDIAMVCCTCTIMVKLSLQNCEYTIVIIVHGFNTQY